LHRQIRLKFFRPNHGRKEVTEEQDCDDGGDNNFHIASSKFVTEADIEAAQAKESDHNSNENQIIHDVNIPNGVSGW